MAQALHLRHSLERRLLLRASQSASRRRAALRNAHSSGRRSKCGAGIRSCTDIGPGKTRERADRLILGGDHFCSVALPGYRDGRWLGNSPPRARAGPGFRPAPSACGREQVSTSRVGLTRVQLAIFFKALYRSAVGGEAILRGDLSQGSRGRSAGGAQSRARNVWAGPRSIRP